MKHLVSTQSGTPSESVALHDDRDPAPGPRDVLVRMEAAAVNPSDLLLLRGLYFARPEPPAPVGGEGVGIVVGAGAQADRSRGYPHRDRSAAPHPCLSRRIRDRRGVANRRRV